MKVISGLLPETWGYFCMKNCISTTRNCHSHIHENRHYILFAFLKVHPHFCFLVWIVGPLNSWAPWRRPGWPSLSMGVYIIYYYIKQMKMCIICYCDNIYNQIISAFQYVILYTRTLSQEWCVDRNTHYFKCNASYMMAEYKINQNKIIYNYFPSIRVRRKRVWRYPSFVHRFPSAPSAGNLTFQKWTNLRSHICWFQWNWKDIHKYTLEKTECIIKNGQSRDTN
jgi:hypothetical protein